MNFRSNKIAPPPIPQNLEGSIPLATTVKLDSGLLDLIGKDKEKKVGKSDKMRISD